LLLATIQQKAGKEGVSASSPFPFRKGLVITHGEIDFPFITYPTSRPKIRFHIGSSQAEVRHKESLKERENQ